MRKNENKNKKMMIEIWRTKVWKEIWISKWVRNHQERRTPWWKRGERDDNNNQWRQFKPVIPKVGAVAIQGGGKIIK